MSRFTENSLLSSIEEYLEMADNYVPGYLVSLKLTAAILLEKKETLAPTKLLIRGGGGREMISFSKSVKKKVILTDSI